MQRTILIGVGGYALVNAAYIWGATQHWYDTVPGVMQTGPLNVHFARDVGLVFLSSGIALIWAGRKVDRSAAVCGAAWLVFHAAFHLWIWMHRGFPADIVALTNFAGIQIPAGLAIWAALTLHGDEVNQ